MSGGLSNAEDSVKQNQSMSEQMTSQLDSARRNPEKELGMPDGELKRRRAEAMSPHSYVSDKSERAFDVKSSARAQQIMSKGVDTYQRNKRKAELQKQMKVLNRFRIGIGFAAVLFAVYVYVDILLPRQRAVKARNAILEERYQRAQKSLEAFAQQQDAAAGGKDNKKNLEMGMIRKYRIEDTERKIK